MANFIYDNVALPPLKNDFRASTRPNQEVTADNLNLFIGALDDLRAEVKTRSYHAKIFGIKNDGSETTSAFQTMLDTVQPGEAVFLPRGSYAISGNLRRQLGGLRLIGEYGETSTIGGTHIKFSGTGKLLEIGTDDGIAWNTGPYDGKQDTWLTNICLSHVSPDTPLVSIDGVSNAFKAGSTGIWDWRGGHVTLYGCRLFGFEQVFAAVKSDFNRFVDCIVSNTKYGIYLGPKCDQNYISRLNAFFSDRAVTIDGANQTVIDGGSSFAFCGHNTCAGIEVRRGSASTVIANCWFEKSGAGYNGSDNLSCISVGEVDGYGAGGSITSPGGTPNTNPVNDVRVDNPLFYSTLPGAYHTKYMISAASVRGLVLTNPGFYAGGNYDNFDSQIGIQAGQTVNATDCIIDSLAMMRAQAFSKCLTHLGTGSPTYRFTTPGATYISSSWSTSVGSGSSVLTVDSTGITTPGASVTGNATLGAATTATHTMRGAINHASPANATAYTVTNSNTLQTVGAVAVRYQATGSYDTTAGALFPVMLVVSDTTTRGAGANSIGATGISVDIVPGTGKSGTAITTARGNNDFNTSSGTVSYFRRSIIELGKATTVISANTDNLAGATGLQRWYLNPSGAFNLTGIVATEDGHRIRLYNISANALTLKHAVTSTATNQFLGLANADTVLAPGTTRVIEYTSDAFAGGKWVVLW